MMDETPIKVDGALTLTTGSLDDWYLIERAEHDGRSWFESIPGGAALCLSSRISDADVEGTRAEMLGIAKAIERREAFFAKRCSVSVVGEEAFFKSPRNSMRAALVPLSAADALAAEIRTALG